MVAAGRRPEKPSATPGWLVTLAGLAFVVGTTLRHGDPDLLQPTPLTCLVCGDVGLVDVWRNVVLFMPFGAGLAMLGRRGWVAATLGFALSLAIEAAQHTLLDGRDASLSDVLTNTLGTLTGATLARTRTHWLAPDRHRAARLAIGGAAAWAGLLVVTGLGMRWASPAPPYQMNRLPPRPGELRAFEGRVIDARIGERPARPGPYTGPLPAARDAGALRLRAVVEPTYPPGKLRPIIWVVGNDWRNAVVLGQRGDGALLRLHTRAATLRLANPTFVLDGAFPRPGARVTVEAMVMPRGVTLRARGPDGERVRHMELSLARGWTLLQPWSWRVERLTWLFTAIWLAAPAVAIAGWTGLARRSPGAHGMSAAAIVAVVVMIPVAIGAALDLAPLRAAHLGALAVAAFAGVEAARAVRRRTRAVEPLLTTPPS